MKLEGIVIDKVTGAPLAGATLALDGKPLWVTDSSGQFNINTTMQGEGITFSYVGYLDLTYPVDQLSNMFQIPMQVNDAAGALAPVVVTPTSSGQAASIDVSSKPNTLFPILLAGGALLLLAGSGAKKRKVSGAVNTSTILLAGGAAIAVYLLTRPKVPTYTSPPVPVYNPAYMQAYANQGNQTAQDISAGGAAASAILNAISNF
jgi:hypothetical protein